MTKQDNKRKFQNMKRLKRNFFRDHPKEVAKKLLGKYLLVKLNNIEVISKIVETEAYGGKNDKACHVGRFGLTKRTKRLFGQVGLTYIYSVHINTYCLNIVAHKQANAGGVLIRSLEPLDGVEAILKNLKKSLDYDRKKLLNGPGKLCQALNIDKRLNGEDIVNGKKIFIVEGEKIKKEDIVSTPRINIPYAGISKNWRYRFIIRNSQFLSR